ncbi:PH domain-containing protein [Mycobacterium sp.]|uniref:PH domain-containing protein n=1 Tax=Mycobacterium sp. TaxID=1785 RepID=UPI0012825860|nr:PH domain-containing protein [Mycobacterium sp.]KAA8968266.1 MAG: PH domain-containing protein [Mycobacterium sp.]
MGYPDNVLTDGEQVVLHRHPHWKRLVGAVVVLPAATALASFVAAVVNAARWDPTARNVAFAGIGAIWLVVVSRLTLRPYLSWVTTHFVITDRRVMFRHGLLARGGIDIPLARILHVEFQRGILDRIVGTGTLIIESASQDPLEFCDIPRVQQVHALLCQEVFDTLESGDSSS